MNCPFLSDTRVRFCGAAARRKLIPLAAIDAGSGKCQSARYRECAVYRERAVPEDAAAETCPWLRESLMQFCAAAPSASFVPYSESLLSRCGSGAHRYCQVYASMAHPAAAEEPVEGIAVPRWLRYTANHFWIDVAEDGVCHIGIDAFLARVLGRVERLSFPASRGLRCPAVAVTAAGVDLELAFPNPIELTACNVYLRAASARLTGDPYSTGWLFEGAAVPDTCRGLIEADQAPGWMEREVLRMNEYAQQLRQDGGHHLAADGGEFAPGLIEHLEREETLALFHEFFSPLASGKR
jgi:glycine cleavage system H protein